MTAGLDHTCAARAGGSVWCWGSNSSGQRGTGDTVPYPIAVQSLVDDAAEVSAGDRFTCARTGSGTVWCWGRNEYGQLGNGTSGAFSAQPVEVQGLTDVIQVASGGDHACALTESNSAWCWGRNKSGQLGSGVSPGTPELSATPVEVTGSFVQVVAGSKHTCAVSTAGGVSCWGHNLYGQLGDGTLTDRATPGAVTGLTGAAAQQIVAGEGHSCARMSAGTLLCWGANGCGQLGQGGEGFFCNFWEQPSSTPVAVSSFGASVAGVFAGVGASHNCALKSDGTLWCWGVNGFGQLGDGTAGGYRGTPVQVGQQLGWTQASTSSSHTCARASDGTIWCWGDSTNGKTGNAPGRCVGLVLFGICTFQPTPLPVAGTCIDGSMGDGVNDRGALSRIRSSRP